MLYVVVDTIFSVHSVSCEIIKTPMVDWRGLKGLSGFAHEYANKNANLRVCKTYFKGYLWVIFETSGMLEKSSPAERTRSDDNVKVSRASLIAEGSLWCPSYVLCESNLCIMYAVYTHSRRRSKEQGKGRKKDLGGGKKTGGAQRGGFV